MKTIVQNGTNLSKYLLSDDTTVTPLADSIVVGDPAEFIIGDMNANTATVYNNVTAPEDWVGNKYTFDGVVWALNSAFTPFDSQP